MLIHELSKAIQQDRERAMCHALATRRHLAETCRERGVVARLRGALRHGAPVRHPSPRVPAGRADLRPTR
jgi:hypothetical protein